MSKYKNTSSGSKTDETYDPMGREKMENRESPERKISTDLPQDRFQGTAQVETISSTLTPNAQVSANGRDSNFVRDAMKNLKVKNKVKIRPSSSDELLEGTQVGGVPIGSGQGVNRTAAGGFKVSTVEDASKIPYNEGGYRPNSRQARQSSDNDFIINNTISEQIAPDFMGSKDLRHSDSHLQGYNGQKQFTTARGKKNAGFVPQSTLYDRSIDFHYVDATVHSTGQVLSYDGRDAGGDYPTKTVNLDYDPADENSQIMADIVNPMKKSNYVLKDFHFTITNGRLSNIGFNEDEICSDVGAQEKYQANMNFEVDRNNVAKTVVKLQKDLGRETTEKWSPLGYIIHQPYQYNMLAHDIEATTGAMQLAAYRAANSSLAFQSYNKLAKDGAKPQSPVLEMFLQGMGMLDKSINLDELGATMNEIVFSKEFMRLGSASAIIAMMDSTSKYETKANFFNLPRSLKYFVQNMDNNINPLHCKKEFLMALDTAHVYSNFDGEYNPMLPITATDKISLINPLSLNYFTKGWNRDAVTANNPSGLRAQYAYSYNDLRNIYTQEVRHPIVEGLIAWMIKHESALVKAYGNNAEVVLPAYFSMLAPSMFQSLLCAAAQEILWARSIYFKDFLFAGDQTEYIWPDLSSLSELNPKFSSNMVITDYKTPIKMGKMKPASFIHYFWGDNFQVLNTVDPGIGAKEAMIVMPYYYNEQAFDNDFDLTYGARFYKDNDEQYTMSFPEIRVGVCHDYIDYVFSMDERDLRLALDRSIGIPIYCVKKEANTTAHGGPRYNHYYLDQTQDAGDYIQGNVHLDALRYDTNSDGRVVVTYKNTVHQFVLPNKAAIYALPREIGYLYPSLRVNPIIKGLIITTSGEGANRRISDVSLETYGNYTMNSFVDGSNSHSIISYAASGHGVNSNTISRTAALQQDFCAYFADRSADAISNNADYISKTGMCPSLSCLFAQGDTNNTTPTLNSEYGVIRPFYALGGVNNKNVLSVSQVLTMSRSLWTLINRFFMPIDMFMNSTVDVGTKEDTSNPGVFMDSLEACYIFGLSGFLASNFSQDVLNRADIVDQLNMDYTDDEFIKSSLIFRAD